MIWSLGPCKFKYAGMGFEGLKEAFTQNCCLEVGEHKLTCESKLDPAVWAKSDGLMIQGHKYCTYFVGRKARQIIYISGKYYEFSYTTITNKIIIKYMIMNS